MLEAQLNYRIEAHKCELGALTRGTLVTIGSGPNSPPPLKRGDGMTETRWKKISEENRKKRIKEKE